VFHRSDHRSRVLLLFCSSARRLFSTEWGLLASACMIRSSSREGGGAVVTSSIACWLAGWLDGTVAYRQLRAAGTLIYQIQYTCVLRAFVCECSNGRGRSMDGAREERRKPPGCHANAPLSLSLPTPPARLLARSLAPKSGLAAAAAARTGRKCGGHGEGGCVCMYACMYVCTHHNSQQLIHTPSLYLYCTL